MNLNNKFDIGQELYTVIRTPIKYDCPICKGEGKFNHNGYDVKCPKCQGTGKLEDSKTIWNVAPKVRIRSIKANIHSTNQQTIKYMLDCNEIYIKSRPEPQLFDTIKEAEQFCYDNNHPIKKCI